MCPNNGVPASVWGFECAHRCWGMWLHTWGCTDTVRESASEADCGKKSLATPRTRTHVSAAPGFPVRHSTNWVICTHSKYQTIIIKAWLPVSVQYFQSFSTALVYICESIFQVFIPFSMSNNFFLKKEKKGSKLFWLRLYISVPHCYNDNVIVSFICSPHVHTLLQR